MMEEGFGHIINISSVCGIAGMSCRSSYSSAKFAIIGLMDSIRNEVSYTVDFRMVEQQNPCMQLI